MSQKNDCQAQPDKIIRKFTCAHCLRTDVGTFQGGHTRVGSDRLCYPNVAGRPNCYNLVTEQGHTMPCAECAVPEGSSKAPSRPVEARKNPSGTPL